MRQSLNARRDLRELSPRGERVVQLPPNVPTRERYSINGAHAIRASRKEFTVSSMS